MPEQKFNIWPLDRINYVPRTPFLQSLVRDDVAVEEEIPLEEQVIRMAKAGVEMDSNVLHLARTYKRYRNKNARLPNFSRWATGMFRDDKDLAKVIATAGQKKAVHGVLSVRTDAVSILKGADSPHFYSCLVYHPESSGEKKDIHQWGNILKYVVEETPGIAIIGVEGPDGKYIGRAWLHHAIDRADGGNVVVPYRAYGQLTNERVIAHLKGLGVRVAEPHMPYYSQYNPAPAKADRKAIVVDYEQCFERTLHWDHVTPKRREGYTVAEVL